MLFEGANQANQFGLWLTNGTPAGTHEIISIAGANPIEFLSGSSPGFTVFNGEVLFQAQDAAYQNGLWVTDGTAAGTHEITGISGAFAEGLFHGLASALDFVVLNGKVLFNGVDAAYQNGLWVTDGTAAGTHEITGFSGDTGSVLGGPSPPDLTVFNNEVLFNGLDAAGNNGLWVTDGTAAGTHELTGIRGANAAGVNPHYMTVFKSKVLFEGIEADGTRGLWVTDGTAAGTHELTGIRGANPSGLSPAYLTAFKGEVLFNGVNNAGDRGLWVTNGTAASTGELTGISGADPSGLDPSGFTVLSNNEVLFKGLDSSGERGLWVTNGTVAGTHEITGISGASTGGLTPTDLTAVSLSDPTSVQHSQLLQAIASFSPTALGTGSPLSQVRDEGMRLTDHLAPPH